MMVNRRTISPTTYEVRVYIIYTDEAPEEQPPSTFQNAFKACLMYSSEQCHLFTHAYT